MAKPRGLKKLTFPFPFSKNGRVGKIYKLGNGTYKTHFIFAGKAMQNTFATFDAAHEFLEGEFARLDTDRVNALSLNPLNSDIKNYSELEQLLREKGGGATLREAVTFYLANYQHKRFVPEKVKICATKYVASQVENNISPGQIKTLEKHFRRFNLTFGSKNIHSIPALEIADWMALQKDAKSGKKWGITTRRNNLGSLVSLSLFARDTLKAIPDWGKTEFQKIRRAKKEDRKEVEIYTPAEMEKLLLKALETDFDLIPTLVIGGFQGLRPAEFHAEGTNRKPLTWERFIWHDNVLSVSGQKVRSKATRPIPIHPVTQAWLEPFRELTGPIWKHAQANTKKMIALRLKADVRSIYDGLRHSYASYRIRHMDGDLSAVAEEMGNSPSELINSYKRNVKDEEADAWFAIMPPADYAEHVAAVLEARKDLRTSGNRASRKRRDQPS